MPIKPSAPRSLRRLLLALLLAGIVPLRAHPVLEWNDLMLDAIRASNTAPTLSTRNLAMLNLAMWDAVNSVRREHQRYRFQLTAPVDASPEAAAVGAARYVVPTLYPASAAGASALFNAWWQTSGQNQPATDGLALGEAIGRLTIESRANDGAATQVPYIPSAEPGEWRRTPPFFRPPLDPHWRWVDPFAIPAVDPFVVPPPPPLDSPEYATAFSEVAAIGAMQSRVRTPEQSLIATFWSDFSYTAMPPGHWYEIAIGIARDQGTGLEASARLMALLSLAQADAAIVCWEGKYRYNFWRPVTAIQRADEDDNPATVRDANWDSWLVAPNFPEYPSGHSTFSRAGAEILARFYGTDALTFSAASDSVPGVTRTYSSLKGCADEVGLSRIYGGIHFEFANREGKRSGAKVAQFIASNWLLPLDQLPLVRLEGVIDGHPQLRVHGIEDSLVRVESSTNLRDWSTLGEITAIPGGVELIDDRPPPADGFCFYRATTP